MSASKKTSKKNSKEDRQPVMLSKDEALYPPDPKALKIAAVAFVIILIITIAVFVTNPVL